MNFSEKSLHNLGYIFSSITILLSVGILSTLPMFKTKKCHDKKSANAEDSKLKPDLPQDVQPIEEDTPPLLRPNSIIGKFLYLLTIKIRIILAAVN